ncbi:hypothetical protein NPIL_582561, partial [Nephila pilipes]
MIPAHQFSCSETSIKEGTETEKKVQRMLEAMMSNLACRKLFFDVAYLGCSVIH